MAYLLNKIDGRLQIQSEVDEFPFDALALVLLLLKDEHLNVVEEDKKEAFDKMFSSMSRSEFT